MRNSAVKTVCILTGSMSFGGGTQRAAVRLAEMLLKTGLFRVVLIDFNRNAEPVFFPFPREVVYRSLRSGNVWQDMRQLRRWLKEFRPSDLILVECMLGKMAVPAAFLTGARVIVWEHGNFFQKQAKDIDLVRRFELLFCKAYVVLTRRDRRNFRKGFPLITALRRNTLRTIYNPAVILPPEEISYDLNSKKIISVGLYRPIKGYDLLVEVARKVFDRHPDWRWDVYGSTRHAELNLLDPVFEKVREYGLEKNLFFPGEVSPIEPKYCEAAILVMTSRMEGMPLALLEGKTHALPLVSFDIETGPDEIIRDGEDGYLVPPYDVDLMAEKINWLIENPETRKAFSANSQKRLEPFREETVLAEWLKLLV